MRKRFVVAVLAVLALLALAGCSFGGLFQSEGDAQVTIVDENGTTLGVVDARVADTADERYQGLSGTKSLANGSGMLFVYPDQDRRTFVMRDMNYPLDIIFVGADGRITVIHHADVPDSDTLERYEGNAKWVLEVPQGWAAAHNVSAGDQVQIAYR